MGNPRLDWKSLVASHATVIGVTAFLTGIGVGKYERVQTTCEHGSSSVIACRFIQRRYCCRSKARVNQTGRGNVGESISRSLVGRKDSVETRIKKGETTRKRAALNRPLAPNLLYVGLRGDLVKIGRCLENRAQRWFKDIDLHVVEAWDLPGFAAGALELKIHDKFGHLRVLDPCFGKGWTEVFDVDPGLIISFVESELQLSNTTF